jgi:uncharacterized protein (TIGR03437 family)
MCAPWLRFAILLGAAHAAAFAQSASLTAAWTFQNTLNPVVGSAALVAVDPLNRGTYVTDTVLGTQRTVYQFSGLPTEQAGLSLSTVNVVNPLSYSFEMVFAFTERAGTFRRVFDVLDRTSDRGLYLNALNRYTFSTLATGTATQTTGQYQHVVLTVTGNRARVYVNGQLDINLGTNSMNLETPNRVVHFFLDNLTDQSRQDYASGRIALLRAYTNELSASEVTQLARDPFSANVGATAPSFTASGVRNGASFSETTPLAPGAFFSIFGASLSAGTGDWSQAFVDGNGPRSLNGTRVFLGSQEAVLVFTSPGQVNGIAPEGLAAGPISMVVERDGVRSAPVTVQVGALNPAFFTYDQRNRRFAATLAADNSAYIAPRDLFGVNTVNGLAVRPARPGEFVIAYAMGLGPTNPAVPTGRIPAPRDGGYPVTGQVRLTLGTRTVTPLYTGLSSFAGVYLVGFQVPGDQADGEFELRISINNIPSALTYLPVAQ